MVIFFDIDETLVNQRHAEATAARHLLANYRELLDWPYSIAEFCRLWRSLREKHAPAFHAGLVSVKEQRRRRIRELVSLSGRTLGDAEADRLFDFYEIHYRNSWSLYDDVVPLLEALSGYSCGIISNGSTAQQRLKLKQTGIERYFDVIVVSEDAGVAKPQREIFISACRQAGSSTHRCVYVGDRLDHDVLPSRAVGMRAFWLDRTRGQSRPDLEVIGSLTELSWKLTSRVAV